MSSLGAKPRKPDPRDWSVRAVLPASGPGEKIWPTPIRLDQGGTGTCVANAWTHLLTSDPIQHTDKKLLNPAKQPTVAQYGSGLQYWTAAGEPRAAEKFAVKLYDTIHNGIMEPLDPDRNDGCYTDNGAKVLVSRGLVSAYYRAASADEVRQTVLTKGPVVFASPWYSSMDSTHDGWVNVDVATTLRGHHAYLITAAYADGSLDILNSWGWGWGRKGKGRISLDDLRTLYIGNAWIATEVP